MIRTTWRCWWLRDRGAVGSVTPFVLIAMLALLPLAGLVIDGGRQLNGRARAIAYAQEAARAGAQALDLDVEETRLVPELAEQIAARYCEQAMENDAALTECEPLRVPDEDQSGEFITIGVQTTVEVDPLLLDMFGAGALESRGRAVARAFTGITEADEGAVPTVPPPTVATQDPGDGGLPTVGPGEQPPNEPGELPPCVTPSPTPSPDEDDDGGGNGGGGNGGGGNGGGGNDADEPTPTPTPTPTTPTTPPPNNDLDDDNAPDCPTTPSPAEDEQPGDGQ